MEHERKADPQRRQQQQQQQQQHARTRSASASDSRHHSGRGIVGGEREKTPEVSRSSPDPLPARVKSLPIDTRRGNAGEGGGGMSLVIEKTGRSLSCNDDSDRGNASQLNEQNRRMYDGGGKVVTPAKKRSASSKPIPSWIRDKKWRLLGEVLGKGSFGTVSKVMN